MKAVKIFLFIILVCNYVVAVSQPLSKAATNVFLVTRMIAKFHVQPRVLNDDLSNDFYNQFLKSLDEEHIYFNQQDIKQLSAYRFGLDEQVQQKKIDFLKLVTSIYSKRLEQADTVINAVARKPFNFSISETYTVAEDSTYPANVVEMYAKLYKKIKDETLNDLVEFYNDLPASNQSKQKKLDSAQTAFQKKNQSIYIRNIKRIVQSPGGIEQFMADEYCKALASCYDPHTEFFPLTEEENFESELGSQRFRFGFGIKEGEDGGVIINELEPGSPAFKCGLLNKGDKFQTVQWQNQNVIDVSDATPAELGDILSQSNHDKVTITVKKSDGTERTVSLVKEQADADEDTKVKSFIIKGNKAVGYVSLPAFYNNWEDESGTNNGCANDVAKEIVKLKKENISGLILDLRYNGGGSVQEAVELSGIFIDAGPVAQLKEANNDKIVTLKDVNRGTIYDGPLIILVNGYSASASELVAGTLQDYNRALIIGSSTYGKATGQIVFPLDTTVNLEKDFSDKKTDNYLKITNEKLYRITGASAQFTGVKPDIILPDFLEADPQREADESFALKPTTIDANKYYKPYPALPLGSLQSNAKKESDTIKLFKQIQEYVREYKILNTPSDVSLNWKDALLQYQKDSLIQNFDSANYKSIYIIQNNAFDLERFKSDASSTEINQTFINYLSRDPYIKVSYDLLAEMSK